MASLDNNITSFRAGTLLRRHGGIANSRHAWAISSRALMASKSHRGACSSAFTHRIRANTVRALETKRSCGRDRFLFLDH